MSTNPFLSFIAFIEADRIVSLGQRDSGLLMREQEGIEKALKERQAYVETIHKQVRDAHARVLVYELELKSLKEREKTIRYQLDSVSSPKEYTALMHETEAIAAQYKSTESMLLDAWQAHEEVQEAYEKELKELQVWEQEQRVKLDRVSSEIAEKKQVIDQAIAERDMHEKQALPELLVQFKSMKQQVPDPVVPLEGAYCSGCHYQVPQHAITTAHHNKLVQCTECFRLLYARPRGHA